MSRQRRDKTSVLLVAMPWARLEHPSIQLGILKTILNRGGVPTQTWSAYLDFADHVVRSEAAAKAAPPLTHLDYDEVASNYHIGDWIFSVPPFHDTTAKSLAYLDELKRAGLPESLISACLRFRAHVPKFLDRAVGDILRQKPKVIGFTTTFGQTVASLVLSKMLKLRRPDLKIVFGGANCDGPMGDAIIRAFDWVDVVVKGEAENVVLPLLRSLLSDKKIPESSLVRCASSIARCKSASVQDRPVVMDEAVIPDYSEFFSRLAETGLAPEVRAEVSIPFETSRGCWWGAKHHCTFCGLNGSTMAFRSMSASVAVAHLLELSKRYKSLRFHAVDNIIDPNYLKTVLPDLAEIGVDLDLFYEIKSNVQHSHICTLSAAGVRQIQPGIESLSTPILKLMKKGVSALQNIRLLRWCEEEGVKVYWNLLYGFPGEPVDQYEAMADLALSLVHLQPPILARLQLQRFSPYFDKPHEHALEIEGPVFHYAFAYPCSSGDLFDLAYDFNYRYVNHPDPESYVAPLRAALDTWRTEYIEHQPSLICKRGPDFVKLIDRRWSSAPQEFVLEHSEAEVYLACEDGASIEQVLQRLENGAGGRRPDKKQVLDFLGLLHAARLVYREGDTYLGLACRPSSRRRSAVQSTANPGVQGSIPCASTSDTK